MEITIIIIILIIVMIMMIMVMMVMIVMRYVAIMKKRWEYVRYGIVNTTELFSPIICGYLNEAMSGVPLDTG